MFALKLNSSDFKGILMIEIKQAQEMVFGLDIGTRNVVGTVGYQTEKGFHVIAQCNVEHQTRAMLDGQIHDIARVGETVRQVKEQLETMIEAPLTNVCIAAAGRVLQTVTVRVDYSYDEETVVSGEDLHTLDLLGIDAAQQELGKSGDNRYKFYCVGYSVIRYYLNGELFSSLEGHKATEIGEDIIVTFLPEDVVDGLYSAVERAGLHVANLTLEPIAAINVAIPENFRMLNIALVDVGAGTSDICVTRDGSIIAYGMIPLAGDELTEAIVHQYLVEFAVAEQIKIDSTIKEEITYEDIMGLQHTIPAAEVWKLLEPIRENMTTEVANKIKELNGDKSVSATFVVGGGGKVHGYTDSLAEKLEIVKERVALRGEEVMKNITFEQEEVKKDPLLVTPIGICLNYYEQRNNFIMIHFNGEMMKLYDNGQLTVVDAAMQAGFATEELFPKRGKEINFTVNGVQRMARGEAGESAVVLMNGVQVGMNTPLEFNCNVEIQPSTTGGQANITIDQLDEFSNDTVNFFVNARRVRCPKFVEVNGSLEPGGYQIQDGDVIETRSFYTLGQLAEFMDVEVDDNYEMLVNNRPATFETLIYENFTIDWTIIGFGAGADVKAERYVEPGVEEESEEGFEQTEEQANAADAAPSPSVVAPAPAPAPVEAPTTTISVNINGANVTLTGKEEYIFVDIFNYIDFDTNAGGGRPIITEINGVNCSYTQQLHMGDTIKIAWGEL